MSDFTGDEMDDYVNLDTPESRVRNFYGDNKRGLNTALSEYGIYKYNFHNIADAKDKWVWIEEKYLKTSTESNIPYNHNAKQVAPVVKPAKQAGAILGGLAAGAVLGGLTGYAIGQSREPQVVVVRDGANKKRTTDAHGGSTGGNATKLKRLNGTPVTDNDLQTTGVDTVTQQENMQPIDRHSRGSGHGHRYGPGWGLPLALGTAGFTLGALSSYAISQRPQVIFVNKDHRFLGYDGNYYNRDGTLFYTVGSNPHTDSLSSQAAQVEIHLQNVEGLKDYWEKFKSKFTGKSPPPKKEKNKDKNKETESKKRKEEKEKRKSNNGGKSDEALEEAISILRKKQQKMRNAQGHAQRVDDEYLKNEMMLRRDRRFFKLQEIASPSVNAGTGFIHRDIKYMNTPGSGSKLHVKQLNATPALINIEDDDGIDLENTFMYTNNSSNLCMIEYDTKMIAAKIGSSPGQYSDTELFKRAKNGLSELQSQLTESTLAYDTDLSMYERYLAEKNMLPAMASAVNSGDAEYASLLAQKYDKYTGVGANALMNDTHKFLATAKFDQSRLTRWWIDTEYQKLTRLLHGIDFISLAKIPNLPELKGTLAVITPQKVKIGHLVAIQPFGTEVGIGREGKLVLFPAGFNIVTQPNDGPIMHQNFFAEATTPIPIPFQLLVPVVLRSGDLRKPSSSTPVDILNIMCTCALVKEKSVKLNETRTIYSMKLSNKQIMDQNPDITQQPEGTRLGLFIFFDFNNGVLSRIYTVLVKYIWTSKIKAIKSSPIASNYSSPSSLLNETMSMDGALFSTTNSKPSSTVLYQPPHVSYGGLRQPKNLHLLKTTKGDGIPKGFGRVSSKFTFDSNNDLIVYDGDTQQYKTPEFLTIDESIARMDEVFTDPIQFNDINGLAADIKNKFTNYFALGLVRDLMKTNKPIAIRLWDNLKKPLEENKRVKLVYGEAVEEHRDEILELGNLSANDVEFDVDDFDQISGLVQKVMTTPLNGLLSAVAKIKTNRNVPLNIYVPKEEGKKFRILEIPPESHPTMNISDFFGSYSKKRELTQKYIKAMMFSIQIGKEATNQLKNALQGCPRTFSITFDLSSPGVRESLRSQDKLTYYAQFINPHTNANFKSNKTQKLPALLIVERVYDPSKSELGRIGSMYIIYEHEISSKVQDDQ